MYYGAQGKIRNFVYRAPSISGISEMEDPIRAKNDMEGVLFSPHFHGAGPSLSRARGGAGAQGQGHCLAPD